MSPENTYIYDIETYPNCFTCAIIRESDGAKWMFEVSDYCNQCVEFMQMMDYLRTANATMVGYNNIGFDYPVIHMLLQMRRFTAQHAYEKAQAIIQSQWNADDGDANARWVHQVRPSDRVIAQLDLFKIHHFDNKAKSTSLKALEFAMKSDNIEDLPFHFTTILNPEQIEVLKSYNMHDVEETRKFYHKTLPMIEFREELTKKYDRDFMNHNDTKIGGDYFIMRLEQHGVGVYEYGADGRKPRQTKRDVIHLKDAVLSWIEFQRPEFQKVITKLRSMSITETKGVFGTKANPLQAKINGFAFMFGTGGIHGSLESEIVESNDEYVVIDLDVASYYPNLAIANDFHPEQYDSTFCHIYKDVYEMRKSYKKGTPENAMLKLALNGVYGNSNNRFSVFYDPLYTMRITLNGQLLLCLLSEHLMTIDGLRMIQVNTDGLTVRLKRSDVDTLRLMVQWWEWRTGLQMEEATYSKMIIRDVNNYLAVYESGDVKRKGAYESSKEWHKDASALVVPKVAGQVLIHGGNIRELVENHDDIYDFFIRVKVPRSSKLVYQTDDGVDVQVQNTSRVYASKNGHGCLFKIMPPTKTQIQKGKTDDRRIGFMSGVKVQVCNNVADATAPIDYDYYVNEVEKLVLGMQ